MRQGLHILHAGRPARGETDDRMGIIIFLPEAELHLLCQMLHHGIFDDAEDLIGWGIKAERITRLGEKLPDPICGLNGGHPDGFIQMIRKERIKLEPEQPPLGEQRAMLLDDREKVRDCPGL